MVLNIQLTMLMLFSSICFTKLCKPQVKNPCTNRIEYQYPKWLCSKAEIVKYVEWACNFQEILENKRSFAELCSLWQEIGNIENSFFFGSKAVSESKSLSQTLNSCNHIYSILKILFEYIQYLDWRMKFLFATKLPTIHKL